MIIQNLNSFSVKKVNFPQNETMVSMPKLTLKADSVNFSGKVPFTTNVSPELAKEVATKLSTSTSGMRSTYGDKYFNADTTALLTQAISARIVNDNEKAPKNLVLVGGDTREATKNTKPQIKDQMANNGFNVLYVNKPGATPAMALAAKELGVDIGFLLTASHNPWSDGGYNLLTNKGAVADPSFTDKVVGYAVDIASKKPVKTSTGNIGQIIEYDPYPLYRDYMENKEINGKKILDFKAIKDAGIQIFYEDFGGTGGTYFPQLMKDNGIKLAKHLSTKTPGPEPNAKNLQTLGKLVSKSSAKLKVGLANDGDSDRFGVVDENGNYINANDVLLLVAYHLNKHKGYKEGAILRSGATTSQLDVLAKKVGLDLIETPVGFKYIGEEMIKLEKEGHTPVIGGEESGGLTIGGHIPEKDGFLAVSLIAELMAMEKKPIGQILKEVKESLGQVILSERDDYKGFATNKEKDDFVNIFAKYYEEIDAGTRKELFDLPVDVERSRGYYHGVRKFKKSGDGVKIYFQNGSSILVRKSGTEPIAKVYIEAYAPTQEQAKAWRNSIGEKIGELAKPYGAVKK